MKRTIYTTLLIAAACFGAQAQEGNLTRVQVNQESVQKTGRTMQIDSCCLLRCAGTGRKPHPCAGEPGIRTEDRQNHAARFVTGLQPAEGESAAQRAPYTSHRAAGRQPGSGAAAHRDRRTHPQPHTPAPASPDRPLRSY